MSDTAPYFDHTVRVGQALHEMLERFSADEKISISRFILLAAAERVSRKEYEHWLKDRKPSVSGSRPEQT